jgi:amino acid transporter
VLLAHLPADGPGWPVLPAVARIHPRYHTPAASIVAQGAWSTLLTLSGSYEQLYTYVIFAAVMFHAATGAAVIVLRRTRPDAPRPYRAWGYPWVPLVFILSSLLLVGNTLLERPTESLFGLALVGLGIPAYLYWRASARARPPRRTTIASRSSAIRRLPSALGTLVSRDIAVLTNAIAFNFLLCLFPLLLVLTAVANRFQGSRAGAAVLLVLQELIPFGHDAIAASLKNLTKIATAWSSSPWC